MAKKFTELRAGMSQAAREKADGMARQMLAEMPLNELRQARGLSQKMLAEVLHVQHIRALYVHAYKGCSTSVSRP